MTSNTPESSSTVTTASNTSTRFAANTRLTTSITEKPRVVAIW